MKKTLFLTLLIVFTVSTVFAGTWVPVLDSARAPRLPEIKVVKADAQSLILEMTVPGFIKSEVAVDGNTYTKVSIPNSAALMEKGMPELPKFTSMVQLPNQGGLVTKILDSQYTDVKLENPVISSKGNLLRNVNPAEVAYDFNTYYTSDEWYPAEKNIVTTDKPFIFRDVRGARAEFTPFIFNPAENTLRVYTKLRILFAFVAGDENSKKLRRAPLASVSDFTQAYKNLFINYTPNNNYTQKEEIGKLSIIAYDDFYNAVLPLKEWKLKTGIETELIKLSEIGADETSIKNFIADRYEQGYTFFILVGDSPQVPPMRGKYERAASDTCYTKIEGNDNVPDAFISRLSGTKVADIENQVAKIINYEAHPTVNDADWYTKGIGIASEEGNPTDYARCDELHESLKNYTYTQLDELYAYSYSNKPSAGDVTNSVNDGRSIINYIGHGSKTSWGTTRFSTSDIYKLHNGPKLPMIWSVACQNGSFLGTSDCFAEAWMKTGSKDKPAGAIAILASSTNAAWIPPCVMQGEIVHNLLCKEQKLTAGGQATNGILKAMEVYGTTDKSQGNMLLEQHNLFGDCTMLIRAKTPQKIEMTTERAENGLTVKVTSAGRSINNARVAIYNSDMSTWESSLTDSDGRATFSADKDVLCTVTGSNLIPVIDAPVK